MYVAGDHSRSRSPYAAGLCRKSLQRGHRKQVEKLFPPGMPSVPCTDISNFMPADKGERLTLMIRPSSISTEQAMKSVFGAEKQ